MPMHFYFSECAVMLYSEQPPDNAAEIIACVSDVNHVIAIPLVHNGHSLTDLSLSLYQSGP